MMNANKFSIVAPQEPQLSPLPWPLVVHDGHVRHDAPGWLAIALGRPQCFYKEYTGNEFCKPQLDMNSP